MTWTKKWFLIIMITCTPSNFCFTSRVRKREWEEDRPTDRKERKQSLKETTTGRKQKHQKRDRRMGKRRSMSNCSAQHYFKLTNGSCNFRSNFSLCETCALETKHASTCFLFTSIYVSFSSITR